MIFYGIQNVSKEAVFVQWSIKPIYCRQNMNVLLMCDLYKWTRIVLLCWCYFYSVCYCGHFNTLRPRHNGRHFADDIFKCIFFNENVRISIKISIKFVPTGPTSIIPALVQIMAWRQTGDKPLSETMMVRLLTHIRVTRPQWVNTLRLRQNGRHFADDLFKCIFMNENVWNSIELLLKLITKGPDNNTQALVQIMAWRRPGGEHYLSQWWTNFLKLWLPTHICVTRPQWFNWHGLALNPIKDK